ncbi:polysaccharide deacetylase family protein [Tenuifilum thalassicum]|uniref:Polysaccharide deacetylase family protein n=1 Tax=Tenuifilum thalassicum TaxID=2590900 RepID=A0A7D3XD51_9BACT|nr:hypothetical protein [Tenuifilum thalassicum]QKG78807.1 hypothetical protein FHG85_00490 [Tenuifilum thalassicum]
MDFTLVKYSNVLKPLIAKGFLFTSFCELADETHLGQGNKIIILRHDVDLKPENSLKTATIEHNLGIRGTYYFRIVKESFDVDIIKQIADLGHEIGYHYETMDTASSKFKIQDSKLTDKQKEQLIDAAYEEFCENLEVFRKIYPVKTICMHGSPKSAFDNRDIWKKYDYRQLGIIGEPYFDIDFDKFFYLTDTGRCWNGYKYSVRDKMPQQEQWIKQGLVFKTTNDIIKAVAENRFPEKAMITIHPQRWTDNYLEWTKELVAQRAKNIIKWGLMRYRAAFHL